MSTTAGHEPKEYHFNGEGTSQGGEHITGHLAKHAGLPSGGKLSYDKRLESETEHEIEA